MTVLHILILAIFTPIRNAVATNLFWRWIKNIEVLLIETYSLLIQDYYVFHDRVTLFFADNFSTECRITIEIVHNFF